MNLTIDKSISIAPAWIMDAMEVGPTWTIPLQSSDWATLECAQELAARYGGKVAQIAPYYPDTWQRVHFNPPTMNYVRFVDPTSGKAFYSNAGYLAKVWARYVTNASAPSPDTADRYITTFVNDDEAYQAWLGSL